MERYAVFAGEFYYPIGGWSDLDRGFSSEEAARGYALGRSACSSGWAQVVDLTTWTVLWDSRETEE